MTKDTTPDWNKIFTYKEGCIYKHPDCKRQGRPKDTPLGNGNCSGKYLRVNVNRRTTYIHRIIWEMHNGVIPKGCDIDHIDGNRLNNKIENLRLCSRKQNTWNRKPKCNKKNNLPKNVRPYNWGYRAIVTASGKTYNSKTFPTIEEASAAAIALREQHHGAFARHH